MNMLGTLQHRQGGIFGRYSGPYFRLISGRKLFAMASFSCYIRAIHSKAAFAGRRFEGQPYHQRICSLFFIAKEVSRETT